jgi:hypothetical protein
MRTTHPITAALAAALTTAALAGPAVAVAADTHNQPYGWHAGTSTIQGSQGERAAATALAGPPTWPVNPQPITRPRAVAARLPGPPTWPSNPQPIAHPSAVVNAPDSGLDWLSAGIGAAAAGLFAIALVGIAGLRRRIARPRSLTIH